MLRADQFREPAHGDPQNPGGELCAPTQNPAETLKDSISCPPLNHQYSRIRRNLRIMEQKIALASTSQPCQSHSIHNKPTTYINRPPNPQNPKFKNPRAPHTYGFRDPIPMSKTLVPDRASSLKPDSRSKIRRGEPPTSSPIFRLFSPTQVPIIKRFTAVAGQRTSPARACLSKTLYSAFALGGSARPRRG